MYISCCKVGMGAVALVLAVGLIAPSTAAAQQDCSEMLRKAWSDTARVQAVLSERSNAANPPPIAVIDDRLATIEQIRELQQLTPPMLARRVDRTIILAHEAAERVTGIQLDADVVCIITPTASHWMLLSR